MDEIEQEWNLLVGSDEVHVEVLASRFGGLLLPDPYGEEKISVRFKAMTLEDNENISKLSMRSHWDPNSREMIESVDVNYMRYYMIRRLLLWWDLPIEIERENDWLTDDCFNEIVSLPAPLINSILNKYEDKISVSDDEEKKMQKQAILLFSPNGNGVRNSCEGVTLFCSYSNFWEKFGLNKFDLKKIPYREYVMLRLMISHESEAQKRRAKSSESKTPISNVVGRGGKIGKSTGTVIRQGGF